MVTCSKSLTFSDANQICWNSNEGHFTRNMKALAPPVQMLRSRLRFSVKVGQTLKSKLHLAMKCLAEAVWEGLAM